MYLCSSFQGLVSLPGLFQVFLGVLTLQQSHPLNFIQVNYKAVIVGVKLLDALPAEDGLVAAAVEVLDAVWVLLAELVRHLFFVVFVELELTGRQLLVLLDYLVQNVDVQRQAFGALKVLDQLATDGATHAVVVVQLRNAAGAQRVAAVH